MRPRRSMVGTAQSSPVVSVAPRWNSRTKSWTCSISTWPSVWPIETDRDLVHAGIARQRAGGELRELLVVAPRHARADLAQVLLDDVEIVEQPLAGGADVSPALHRRRQCRSRRLEDLPRLIEAIEKRPGPARHRTGARTSRSDPLLPCERARVLGQPFSAQELTADRPREALRVSGAPCPRDSWATTSEQAGYQITRCRHAGLMGADRIERALYKGGVGATPGVARGSTNKWVKGGCWHGLHVVKEGSTAQAKTTSALVDRRGLSRLR